MEALLATARADVLASSAELKMSRDLDKWPAAPDERQLHTAAALSPSATICT